MVTSGGAHCYSYSPRTTLVIKLELERNGVSGHVLDNFTLFGAAEDRMDALIDQVAEAADQLHDHASRSLGAVHPETGMHDVVMTSGLTGLLAHEAVGHPCEADHVIMGSAVAEALGRQVASDKITLVDQAGCGFDGNATTACYVDDEGVPARDVVLIEDGRLVSFLHNRMTAGLMNVAPTGNARAGSFAGEPLIRMRNTAILPGQDTLADMIAAIEFGYLLERPGKGQGGSLRQLHLRCHARLRNPGRPDRAGLVEHDGVGQRLRRAAIGVPCRLGLCLDAFRLVRQGQSIPVSMGGPSIKARMMIGGR